MQWPPGAHGTTFGGNPVACAAAIKTIDLLKKGLVENAQKVGKAALDRLRALKEHHECIGDVRGLGLMIGVELVADRKTKEIVTDKRNAVVYEAFKNGLLILGAGPTSIRFIPPLIITEDEMHIGLDIFEKALTTIFHAK
jgi:4-aminobutyrate aminotransferase